jgi:hypothetical protein
MQPHTTFLFLSRSPGCGRGRYHRLHCHEIPINTAVVRGKRGYWPTGRPTCKSTTHATSRLRLKRDDTRAETRFRFSPKRTSPFKLAGASVQSTTGSRGVRISGSNAGYTTFRGSVRVLATHSIRQFSPHFPTRASPYAIRFQTHSTYRICRGG